MLFDLINTLNYLKQTYFLFKIKNVKCTLLLIFDINTV